MEENLNLNELVKIEQMPKLFEKLELVGKWVDESLEKLDLNNLVVSEENKSEIKKIRAEINNTSKELEDRRKFIKSKILEPYEEFNKKYEEEIKNKLTNASSLLKDKIDSIEIEQLRQKKENLIEFFNEYAQNYHLTSILSYENIKINVTLSASEKSLKEQIKGQLESIANDIALIDLEEYKEEILLEYKNNGFNFAGAKLAVVERHKKIQELKVQQETIQETIQQEQIIEEKVEEITAPIEIEEAVPNEELVNENQILIYTFTVTGTKEEIIKIRDYIRSLGVKYE